MDSLLVSLTMLNASGSEGFSEEFLDEEPQKDETEEPKKEGESAPESEEDRKKRVDKETWDEAKRQNRQFLEAKAEKFPSIIENKGDLFKALLEKLKQKSFTSGEQVNQFLENPPSGEGIEDPDLRSIVTEALKKVQPIVDMPQAQERLQALIKGEQTQVWLNERSADMGWYETSEGREEFARIQSEVESK